MLQPLTYTFDRSGFVYRQTKNYIDESHSLKDDIERNFYIYRSLPDLIPQSLTTFFSANRFPLYESWEDLQVSFNLCSQGFYKQSMATLRNVFELNLLSLFMNIKNQGHVDINDWMNSKQNTPRHVFIKKELLKNKNFQLFNQSYNLEEQLTEINELNNYVHTKGKRYSNYMGRPLTGGTQSFSEESLLLWYQSMNRVVQLSVLLHLIRYPLGIIEYNYNLKFGNDVPTMGVFIPEIRTEVKKIIDKDMLELIEDIAKSDSHVIEVMKYVESLPVLTEKELESQFIKQQKQSIEQIGLHYWHKTEDAVYLSIEHSAKYQKQREYLIKWAKANNFIDPPFLRKAKLIRDLKGIGHSLEEISDRFKDDTLENVKKIYCHPDEEVEKWETLYKEMFESR